MRDDRYVYSIPSLTLTLFKTSYANMSKAEAGVADHRRGETPIINPLQQEIANNIKYKKGKQQHDTTTRKNMQQSESMISNRILILRLPHITF